MSEQRGENRSDQELPYACEHRIFSAGHLISNFTHEELRQQNAEKERKYIPNDGCCTYDNVSIQSGRVKELNICDHFFPTGDGELYQKA